MKPIKLNAEDLESDDIIWVGDTLKLVCKVEFNLNDDVVLIFEDNSHIIVMRKKKFELF